MSASAVYEGWVRHRRHAPVEHSFRYRVFMMYLDLDELPGLFDGVPLWSARRPAAAWFRRADFLGDPSTCRFAKPCSTRSSARAAPGPPGPVRLLANLRYLGHSFNPVSFYFCFDARGERVESVLAQVTNTPWGERHAYLLERGRGRRPGAARQLRQGLPRVAVHRHGPLATSGHVSEPGGGLQVHIENHSGGERAFDATLSLERRERHPARPRASAAPLPGDVAAGGRPHLPQRSAAEAEGRSLPPPSGAMSKRLFFAPPAPDPPRAGG